MTIVPASIRNMNPGAQYPGKSSKKFGSSSYETLTSRDGVHKIATFPSNVQGAAALFDLLNSKYTDMTVERAITKWCGAFYVSTYIKVLEDKGGIKRTDLLTKDLLRDPAKAIPLAQAMAWQEAGRDYPMTDAEWAQAHSCAFLEPVAPAFSPENDVPSPKAEMRAAEMLANVTRVAAVATGAGGTATVALTPSLPPVPSAVTNSLANAHAWQGVGEQIVAFKTTIAAAPLTFGGIAIVCALLWFVPSIAAKLGGTQS